MERVACEMIMARVLVELCVKERRVRIPESQRDGTHAITERRRGSVLWTGQMSFGYTSATGGIRFTVRRLKHTQFVVSNSPRALAAERERKGSRMEKKLITCWAMNRVALRNDLIGDDYSAVVEMMDSDDALRGR